MSDSAQPGCTHALAAATAYRAATVRKRTHGTRRRNGKLANRPLADARGSESRAELQPRTITPAVGVPGSGLGSGVRVSCWGFGASGQLCSDFFFEDVPHREGNDDPPFPFEESANFSHRILAEIE